jgi:hypothetical protein
MRPEPSHDPGIKVSEELSDMGSFVVVTPTPHNGIQLRNNLFRRKRDPPFGELADLIFEPIN